MKLDKTIDIKRIKSPYVRSLFVHHTAKFYRLREECGHIKFAIWKRKLFRKWQKNHQGKLPDLTTIPSNSDCCYTITNEIDRIIELDGEPYTIYKHKMCGFYYRIEIPEDERKNHVGLATRKQTHLCGCHLLGKTDDDFRGWGLLWDECKECHLKTHKYIPGEYDDD